MIATILRIHWLNLRRDRVAWVLTFVVPVIFFSIFAVIFGGMTRGSTPRVRVAVVDQDESELSRRLAEALAAEPSMNVQRHDKLGAPHSRDSAEALVRNGDISAAIILPQGIGAAIGRFDGSGPTVEVLADTSDPVAPQMVGGLLQKVTMTAAPESMMEGGIGQLEKWGGKLTDDQKKAVEQGKAKLNEARRGKAGGAGVSESFGLVNVKVIDLLGAKKSNSMVSFYAAATAVMFLLFMCANAAGGALLEEVDSGTLERLLSSGLGMTRLLLGKWLSLTMLGVLQLFVMFLWGALVFRVELFSHLLGFSLMTVSTSAAGAAFGLLLATICKTRGQLTAVSTTVIMIMSAVGGCMFPRVLMSENLQKLGLLTFNGWALDGFIKVFWREAAVWELWPQLLVLTALSGVFLVIARRLARRWESA